MLRIMPPVAAEESDATRGVQHKPAVMPGRVAAGGGH